MPQAGDAAPSFAAEDDTGRKVQLTDYRGSWIVLFFYPKDDTPG